MGCRYNLVSQLEVPPPYYTLQPAGKNRGGLHPGRRSPGGDGGVRGERKGFILGDKG